MITVHPASVADAFSTLDGDGLELMGLARRAVSMRSAGAADLLSGQPRRRLEEPIQRCSQNIGDCEQIGRADAGRADLDPLDGSQIQPDRLAEGGLRHLPLDAKGFDALTYASIDVVEGDRHEFASRGQERQQWRAAGLRLGSSLWRSSSRSDRFGARLGAKLNFLASDPKALDLRPEGRE